MKTTTIKVKNDNSALKYFAIVSMKGSIAHANKL